MPEDRRTLQSRTFPTAHVAYPVAEYENAPSEYTVAANRLDAVDVRGECDTRYQSARPLSSRGNQAQVARGKDADGKSVRYKGGCEHAQ